MNYIACNGNDKITEVIIQLQNYVYVRSGFVRMERNRQNTNITHAGCNRRNGPDFGRVFLRSNYTDIIQSSMVTEILAREVRNIDSYYSLTDYQMHIETGRNMWFL